MNGSPARGGVFTLTGVPSTQSASLVNCSSASESLDYPVNDSGIHTNVSESITNRLLRPRMHFVVTATQRC